MCAVCACSVRVRCVQCARTVCAMYMYGVHSAHVQCVQCAVYTYGMCSVHVRCVGTVHAWCVQCIVCM